MDPDPPPSTPRKVKFAPKGPPRRAAKPITAKIDSTADDNDGDDEAQYQALSERAKEHLTGRGRKAEKKSSVQVAFSHVAASTAIRTFGKQKEATDDTNDVACVKESSSNNRQNLVNSTSTIVGEVSERPSGLSDDFTLKKKHGYREPWDYKNSYYPTTLPWRKPYSGDPEILDEAEFGEGAEEYDEKTLNSASALGLLDQDDNSNKLFFQFPPKLPLGSRQTTKGKEIAESSMMSRNPSRQGCKLEELPEGYMGKMLVYKSGAVKLKLGDILFEVSPGSDSVIAQSVAAVNTISRHCCDLGPLNKGAVVTPVINSLLDHA